MPPPFALSKQWAKILLTCPVLASCDNMEELDLPKPRIPSRAWSGDPKSCASLAPHLQMNSYTVLYYELTLSLPNQTYVSNLRHEAYSFFFTNLPKCDGCAGWSSLAVPRYFVVIYHVFDKETVRGTSVFRNYCVWTWWGRDARGMPLLVSQQNLSPHNTVLALCDAFGLYNFRFICNFRKTISKGYINMVICLCISRSCAFAKFHE